jgi:inward rectifier potassium channel
MIPTTSPSTCPGSAHHADDRGLAGHQPDLRASLRSLPGDLVNAAPGSFSSAFFFSVGTLSTVGYGVMAPSSTYGHVVSATEIVTGTASTAIVTGLLFVRFSRPKAKILYADNAVVSIRNGKPI